MTRQVMIARMAFLVACLTYVDQIAQHCTPSTAQWSDVVNVYAFDLDAAPRVIFTPASASFANLRRNRPPLIIYREAVER
jgi:hypothetical protein